VDASVDRTSVRVLLRDFVTSGLREKQQLVERIAGAVAANAEAVDGLYVATTPYVRLAKVADHEQTAPTAPEELFDGIDINAALAAGAVIG
jgi:hypothetical protein